MKNESKRSALDAEVIVIHGFPEAGYWYCPLSVAIPEFLYRSDLGAPILLDGRSSKKLVLKIDLHSKYILLL